MKCEMNGKSINLFFLSSQIQYNISINNFIEANIKTFLKQNSNGLTFNEQSNKMVSQNPQKKIFKEKKY